MKGCAGRCDEIVGSGGESFFFFFILLQLAAEQEKKVDYESCVEKGCTHMLSFGCVGAGRGGRDMNCLYERTRMQCFRNLRQ